MAENEARRLADLGKDIIYGWNATDSKFRPVKVNDSDELVVSSSGGATTISGGQAADGAAVSGNPVRVAGKDGSGNTQDIATDADGDLQVDVKGALPAGTNTVGGTVPTATAAGNGATGSKFLDVDETEDEVKGSAGQVYGFYFFNNASAVRYLKFYNDTAANVAVGTTVPMLTFPLPSSTDKVAGYIPFPVGVVFSAGITIAATTGKADNDTGAPGADDVVVNVFYK